MFAAFVGYGDEEGEEVPASKGSKSRASKKSSKDNLVVDSKESLHAAVMQMMIYAGGRK